MSFLSTQMNALYAAYEAYRMAANGGPRSSHSAIDERRSQYHLTWDAYCGALYNRRYYGGYLGENNLYSKTRQIYSLVEDVVDFYGFHVYPGVIDDQGVPNNDLLNEGIPLVADDAQRDAIKQIWQWSNWATTSSEWITYGGATGDTYLAVVDDVEAGKVYLETRAPWHIKEVNRDRRGYIESSTEEFDVWDANNRKHYKYRREMTPQVIREYKDGQLTSNEENPYGFVPLIYTQHRFSPGVPGKPAFRGWKTLDEVNSLASRLDDYVRTQADTPMMFAGGGTIKPVQLGNTAAAASQERGITLLQMDKDGSVFPLSGNLDIAQTQARVDSLLAEMKSRNIEVSTYERLRESGNPSGVAARRLLGDVEARLSGPQGNYDSGQILALRQALAIAGMRAKERAGGWADRTEQQRLFTPFDLMSYPKGDLNFSIAKRPLIPDTDLDRAMVKQTLYGAYKAGEDIGIPVLWQMEKDGANEEELAELKAAQALVDGDGFADPKEELANAQA